jgi:serine/threonine-protein kinase
VNFLEGLFKGNELAFDAKRKPGDITARELLDAGAARIDESLKDAPEAKVRLLGVVASLYSQEQDAQAKSKEMYRNRLALARTLKATDGRLLVDAMLDYANIQLAGDDGGSARALLEEAGTVLDKIKPALPGDGELRGRLELELAYMLQQTDPPLATRHAERAVELLRPFEHFDGYATALSFLGDEQAGRLEFTKAMATLTEALRVAPTASMQRVEMLSQRCHARTRSGESEAAIPDCQQAFDVAKRLLGDANGDTAYYARRLAEARATAGQAAPAREFLLGLLPALRSVTAEDRRRDLGAMYVSLA